MAGEIPNSITKLHADLYQALLEVSKAISQRGDLSELLRDLARCLPRVIPFDSIVIMLYDPVRDVMRVLALETELPVRVSPNREIPVKDSPSGWVWQHQQPLIVTDDHDDIRFVQVKQTLREYGIKSYCLFPLTAAQRRLGAMGFGSPVESAYRDIDMTVFQQVVNLVAVAVDNALNFESAESSQRELRRESDRLRMLLEINNAVVSLSDLKDLFAAICRIVREVLRLKSTSIDLYDHERRTFRRLALDYPDAKGPLGQDAERPLDNSPAAQAILSMQPILFGPDTLDQFSSDIMIPLAEEGLRSGCCLPLVAHGKLLGAIGLASKREAVFIREDLSFLSQVADQIAIAVENALAYEQIARLKEKLAKEKLYLEDEIRSEHNFEEIIGQSSTLSRVMKQVATVAPTDSTVLIEGETGTGKELIARAIHALSSRRERTLVKINCAAIPTGLLESELFGHEKGAFTGAIAQKIGRFELAHQGTIFLDEVGEIPLELQSKLLRVLQEQAFERLGSTRTIRVNVRLVAATNRDLAHAVEEKQFRSDLYYRLNVFPIAVPPLRDRAEDIPLLVRHFVDRLSRRMNKRFENISAEGMAALCHYHWPGNIRELENLIERAVIVSDGPELRIPLADLKKGKGMKPGDRGTLEEAEREHILRTLRDSDWIVGGPSGAARRLGMKRTTLISKMQKLGIARPIHKP